VYYTDHIKIRHLVFKQRKEGEVIMKAKGIVSSVVFVGILCCMAMPVFGTSIAFSTGEKNNYSWTVTVAAGTATMSFANNDVDMSSPYPDPVLNDHISLPGMTLTNIQSIHMGPGFDLVTADLTPMNPALLTIAADVASGPALLGDIVMAAQLKNSGMLAVGTNFIAYSDQSDDLDIVNHMAGYSTVIDQFTSLDNLGFNLDLSFSGDVSGSLYNLLHNLNNGSVTGTLSGQIVIVPEPMTLSLIGLGGMMLLRRKL
jgi:hypothetical protein